MERTEIASLYRAAPADGTPAVLTVQDNRIYAAIGGEPFDLLSLLPQQYRGDVAAVEAELDAIVGLDTVKEFVRDIARNTRMDIQLLKYDKDGCLMLVDGENS